MFRTLLLSALLLAIGLTVFAALPVKARPLGGIGLLTIGTATSGGKGEARRLILYKEPRLERVAELTVNRLPALAPVLISAEGRSCAIVTSARPGWLRIVYDEAERQGWVERPGRGEFQRWEQFLPGRLITMLPGLRKDYYLVRKEAFLAAKPLENAVREVKLTVVQVEGDWVKVRGAAAQAGWLRWRDDNGRLTVSVKL